MRLQRLVLHAGTDDDLFTLELHPRLTVVSGAGRLEREGLINELLGALGNSRPGVHLELTDDDGRELAVFRPAGARHRVIDVAAGTDVTAQYERDGSLDLLASAGIPADRARRTLCISGPDLIGDADHDGITARLAQRDQALLWDAADTLREVEAELARFTEDGASTPQDAELVGLIETRHAEVQQATERLEEVRSTAFTLAAVLALLGVVAAVLVTPALTVPFLIAAVGCTVFSWWRWQQVRAAEAAEEEALATAGLSSYLTFQLQRVDSLVSSQEERRQLIELSEIHQHALSCWQAVAGDVDVRWALDHRDEVLAASLRAPDRETEPTATTLVTALSRRLDGLASRDHRPPVVLDEPFPGATDAELRDLIAVVLGATDRLQLVLLTADPRLGEWAHLESLGGGATHLGLDGPSAPAAAPASGAREDHALL